jgi:hypothetical protein
VLSWAEGRAFVNKGDPAEGLGLLVIDPWAAQDDVLADQLS